MHVVHVPWVYLPCQKGSNERREKHVRSVPPGDQRRRPEDKGRVIRRWRIDLRTTLDLAELAEWLNPVIRGWMNYYGKFYRTEMFALLRRINTYIVRWARRKFKRLRAFKQAKRWWNGLLQREPQLFAHWAWMPEF